MIEHQLASLGLSDKEIALYLAVLQQGRVTPTEVARLTGIRRSTVYSVARELQGKGLLQIDESTKIVYFMPPTNATARRAIEKEENRLLQKRDLLREVIKTSAELQREAPYPFPSVSLITEEELPVYLKRRCATWNERVLAADGVWWGFQDHTFVEQYEAWIDWFWAQAPESLSVQLFSNATSIERKMKAKAFARRHIRVWPKKDEMFTTTLWVLGTSIVTISTKQHPYFLMEIEDVALSDNLRHLFKAMWKGV